MDRDGDLSPAERTTIALRPLGSPLPLTLAGLTIASIVLTGLDLGWVPAADSHQVAMAILVMVVPLQTVSCLYSFPARDGASAGTAGVLGATWAGIGLISLTSPPGSTSPALGLGLLASAGLLLAIVSAQAISKPLAALAIGLAAIRFGITGVHELSGVEGWQDAAGVIGIAVAAVAGYAVAALELEDARDRPVLPTFRRGPGRRAVAAPASAQLEGVEHEPGVRRQL